MNLLELGKKHKTDKVGHLYLEHYDQRFGPIRHEEITILEIGTWQGASIRMWREYFDNARVLGFDVVPEWAPSPGDNITIMIGDQEDPKDLSRLAALGPFDIIVDDGGHKSTQHIASFLALWPHVNPCGWYAIEDCFSIFNTCWTQKTDRTILDVIHDTLLPPLMLGSGDVHEIHLIGDGLNDGLILFHKKP